MDVEKENVIDIFEKLKEAIKKKDTLTIKSLSNRTIHSASTYQDTDSIAIAVLVYSLSKIIEKQYSKEIQIPEKFYESVFSSIDRAIKSLKTNNEEEFKSSINELSGSVKYLSGDLKKDTQDVFRKARINKASKIYEHGVSMEQTSKLLGITLWELATYSGQTSTQDMSLVKTQDAKSRIKLAMEFFK